MKLIYVNGFREDDKLSSTYLRLKEAGFDIKPCQWKYGDDVKQKIDKCIQKIKPDLIVASSTAGLFVRPFNIPCQLRRLYHKFKASSNLPSNKIAS